MKDLNGFNIIGLLGRGERSHVLACRCKTTNNAFAIKVYYKSIICNDAFFLNAAKSEIEFLTEIKNAKHCPYQNFYVDLSFVRETLNFVYIGTKLFLGGTLSNIQEFSVEHVLKEKQMLFIISSAIIALYGIHYRGNVHNDVKPDNIFVDESGNLVLGDMEFSTRGELKGGCREFGSIGYVSNYLIFNLT